MNVCVIGTGYVGLVTGACFAEFGVQVVCADADADKVTALQAGVVPIYEPGLEDLVARNVREGRLSFTTDTAEAVRASLVVFIAVATPARGDGETDLTFVEAVAREIGANMDGYKVVVTKSTVPVGTSAKVRGWIEEQLAGRKVAPHFSVASNPEFLREGAAIGDFMRPDRVVIGTEDDQSMAILKDLYRPLYLNETPVVLTDVQTAELTKYAANAFLATKISFINEVANLCEKVGADVQAVARGIGLDRRIGRKFLHAGPGFGGSCFPKDTRSVAHFARKTGERLRDRRGRDSGERSAAPAHDREDRRRPGRRRRGQDRGGPRPLLQAGDGRHARRAVDRHHSGPSGAGGDGSRLSTRGLWRKPSACFPRSCRAPTPTTPARAPTCSSS